MNLSRRERLIAVAVLVVGALWALDRMALTPLLERRQAMAAERAALGEELVQASALLRARRDAADRWREMSAAALGSDSAAAESRLLHAVRGWSREAGLTLQVVQPERGREQGELREIVMRASAGGSMAAVTRFLFLAQTSTDLPLRIERLRLAAVEGGAMTLEVRLSTLYRTRTQDASAEPTQPAGGIALAAKGAIP